jgi:hypothetical protein
MNIKPKGGRGKKAPYETIQMRVPLPLKDDVNRLISRYRVSILEEPKNVDAKAQENLNTALEKLIIHWEAKRAAQSPTNQRWQWAAEILKDLHSLLTLT